MDAVLDPAARQVEGTESALLPFAVERTELKSEAVFVLLEDFFCIFTEFSLCFFVLVELVG